MREKIPDPTPANLTAKSLGVGWPASRWRGRVLRLRQRMAVTAVAASAVALLAVLFLLGPSIRRRALAQNQEALLTEARLLSRMVEPSLARAKNPAALDAVVDDVAREVRARVTIVSFDGRVLADSAVSGAALGDLDSHADRPEVRDALASGRGVSIRRSATVGEHLLYAAAPIHQEGRLLGVARLARTLREVEAQAWDLRRTVLLALALAFATTAVLSVGLSAPLAGPLRRVMDAARHFAAGDLTARCRVDRDDELGELARILNRSADQLQGRITDIARDRARTEAILASMEDGVLAVDHDGTMILANNALRRSLGLSDPLGRHYLEAIRHREVARVLEEVLRRGEWRRGEVDMHHLQRVYAVTAAPFPGAEGGPPGAVLCLHDVTERRRADQVRRDFVANASHELRTPLTSIRGFVEALQDGAMSDPGQAERFLGKIRTHADRMGALVEDLLELSRLESGERPLHLREVQVAEVAEDVVASFADMARRKELALTYRDAGAPVLVTDADRLRRILENLVENAIKYTPGGGRVEVATEAGPEGSALVVVEDDGPGIAAEDLPRLFERFYRVDKARSREMGGTGLGLSIVKHLAEGMGAIVAVESTPGRGTRFVVRLSAGRERQAAPAANS